MPSISRRAVVALAVVAFFAALVVGRLRAGDAGASNTAAATPIVAATAPGSGALVVHVAGAVRKPGVYELIAGDRVRDAIDAAGGVTRRAVLDAVNLAAPVADGQQVLVPREGEPRAVAPGATAVGPVALNSADLAALDALPGVGPATAARIIAWRDEHGPFRSVEDLLEVPGIGDGRLAALRDLVTV